MDKISASIIVPIYNVEKYLAECLDSLERQTLDDIEIIMVNDGSTDNSGDIAKTYAAQNENFCLINRENGGLSAARNSGLDVARGEYVYFLDSDDFLADDAIEKLYKKAKAENLDQLRFVAYTFEDGTKNYLWTGILQKVDTNILEITLEFTRAWIFISRPWTTTTIIQVAV